MSTKNIPDALGTIVEQIKKFPGIGPKSALRCAMSLLDMPEQEVRRLGKNIYDLRDVLHKCTLCGVLSDAEPCQICSDTGRDSSLLCIVAEWDSFLIMEEAAFYKGYYLVLEGMGSTGSAIVSFSDMERLKRRIENTSMLSEIVLALGSTLESETIATYLIDYTKKHFPAITITRLAQGIPIGAEVKFMDKETLRESMKHRQSVSIG
ncbi:MAG: recombination mediator RecR [Desulfovibrionaceae bacterium]